ncbi:alpha-hydroxy-acid oxidizing protein [Nitriliruptor alkaliphilus]|uniref:alpha-hydroxy-acid oxidizing protein n=1 Tax=Nitriliruptor alkaliphilus TaxID=427918 RepID=UPI0006974D23
MAGTLPELPVTYEGLREAARERLDPKADGYVAGSAGSEVTAANNLAAFRSWQLVPRMLRDVAERDLSIRLLDRTHPTPLLLGPVGVQSIVHDEAEVAVAKGAAAVEVPFVLSTVSSYPIEEVAEAAGDGPRWFQLYWPSEDAVADSLIQRAADAGYEAVVVTLDTRLLAWRPRDLATAYLPFLHAEGLSNYLTDPAFLAGLPDGGEAVRTEGWRSMSEQTRQAAVLRWIATFSDPSQTWEDLRELVDRSPLPVLVKGIQHPDDARLAVDAGVAGMVVSNHGGRQVDGAMASLDALPHVVDAVGDSVPVIFDSGIRTGADCAIALALGADAVMIGRPYVWGLALAGAAGVEHVLRCLLADLDLTLALSGVRTVDELTRDVLRPV